MKIKNLLLLIAGAAIILSSCDQKMTGKTKLESDIDSVSYMIGVDIGGNLKESFDKDINYTNLINGVMDGIEKNEIKVDEKEIRPYLTAYFQKVQADKAKANLEEGEAFLVENKKKEGVITTESGLQYEIITEGSGKSPSETDKVSCHYHGTLINGSIFDSSVDRGEPAEFEVNRVIPGWTEGLLLMKEGAKYKFYIPTGLAYGARGAGSNIKPNMALIFEVELLEIKKPEKPEVKTN